MLETYSITCPYCSQQQFIEIDLTGGSHQNYIEDCQVCCQPMGIRFNFDSHGENHSVEVTRSSE